MENLVRLSFDFWSALLAFGVFQGLMMMLVLLGFRRNLALTCLLGLVLVLVLNLFNHLLLSTNLFIKVPHLVYVFTPTLMLIGPLYYWHLTAVFSPDKRIKPLLHLLPFALAIMLLLPFYLLSGPEKIDQLEIQQSARLIPLTTGSYLFMVLQIAQVFAYIIWANRVLSEEEPNAISKPGKQGIQWLRRFGWAFSTYWLLDFLALTLYTFLGAIHPQVFYVTILGTTIFINVLAVFMIRKHKEFNRSVLNPVRVKGRISKSDDEIEETLARIYLAMEEDKPYLDPQFSLLKFSELLEKTPHQVSEILNVSLGKSFYEFINEYRYEEAKERLQSSQYNHLTILAIAFDSGFNNKNTFNKVFKKYSGKTPSQFIKEIS